MNRQTSLSISITAFFVFTIIAYYGARITIWSSIVLGFFVSLIILNIFYPPDQMATDMPDFTLVLYALFEIVGISILILYVLLRTVTDIETCSEVY